MWYVLSTRIGPYSSEETEWAYGNNFTPINPPGTTVTWRDLEGVVEANQPTPNSQPRRDRNDNSPVLLSSPQDPLAQYPIRTTSSPPPNQLTDIAGISSANLVESDWPGTSLCVSPDEARTRSTDSAPLAKPISSSRRRNQPIYIPRMRPKPKQPGTLGQSSPQSAVGPFSANPTSTDEPGTSSTGLAAIEKPATPRRSARPTHIREGSQPKSAAHTSVLDQTPPSQSIGPSIPNPLSTTTTIATTPARKRPSAATCQNCKGRGHTKRNCPVFWCSYCNSDLHKYSECPLAKAVAIVEADKKAARLSKDNCDEKEEEWEPEKGKKRAKKN